MTEKKTGTGVDIKIGSIMKSRDGAAAAPALLLCAATLIMLILDIVVPEMGNYQYMVYPLLIKCAGMLSLLCAAVCLKDSLPAGRFAPGSGEVCFALFLVCIAVSTCINGFSHEALYGVKYRYIGVFDTLSFFVAYLLCSRCIVNEHMRNAVMIAVAAVSDMIAAVFILDAFDPVVEAFRNKNEPAALFFHGNHYGYFIVIAVTLSAGLCMNSDTRQRIFGAVSFILNSVALVMNRSTGCMLAAGVVLLTGALVMFIKNRESRRLIGTFAVAVSAIIAAALVFEPMLIKDVMMDLHDASDIISGGGNVLHGHGRWGLWQQTVEMIRERPLTGYGCEGISQVLQETNVSANPHNEVMTYAAFYGIPAALFYVAGVMITIIRGLRSGRHSSATAACAAAAYFISSLFGVLMFYTAPFFFVLLGIAGRNEIQTEE